MKPGKFLATVGAILFGSVFAVGTARAATLAKGGYSITAHGGGTETNQPFDDGHMDVAGFAVLDGKGGATALNLTVAYQDDDEDNDGPTCLLTNPADLTYSFAKSTGIGTMTLTVAADDVCYPGNNYGNSSDAVTIETGKSISFVLYAGANQARLVSTSATLLAVNTSSNGEVIFGPTMAGQMKRLTPVRPSGQMLLNGTGQTTNASGRFGHESLAGSVKLTRKGGASALDVTPVYSDNSYYGSAETCHLTDPADVAYSFVSKNKMGTFTLTVGANDACYSTYSGSGTPISNSGNSLTFNLYQGNGGLVLVSTNSNLVDGNGDTISDPGVLGYLVR